MALGASRHWKEVIKGMTGRPGMSTSAFREYFQELEDWLKEENERNGLKVGWNMENTYKFCKYSQ